MEGWEKFAAILILGGWSIIGIYAARTLERLRDSVEGLNLEMKIIVKEFAYTKEDVLEHKEEIKDLRERVAYLEKST